MRLEDITNIEKHLNEIIREEQEKETKDYKYSKIIIILSIIIGSIIFIYCNKMVNNTMDQCIKAGYTKSYCIELLK